MGATYDSMALMWALLWPGVAFLVVLAAALAFRAALFAGFRHWSGRSTRESLFLQSIGVPSVLWCIVLALFVAIELADLPRRLASQVQAVLEAAIILSVTITLAGVLASLVASASERRALGVGVTGLAQTSVRLVVLIIGGLVLLSSLGIAITPLLTALGVGGLALALAMQDTLSNLFAGMHLLADRPIRVGDYVRLSVESVEGYVADVGWRSTRVRTLQNNVVIVPNSKVAQSVIINYELPESRMSVAIRVAVDYAADADRVEGLLTEEAKSAVGAVPGLLGDPPPAAKLIPGFGEYSLDFTLVCHVERFVDQFEVQHQLRKRLLRRLRAEGLRIPYPARTVQLRPLDGPG
jgi:small-conductance mechanosensitive channel